MNHFTDGSPSGKRNNSRRNESETSAPDAETIAKALRKHSRQGEGWIACCPVHDDKTPSLSIGNGRNGRPLWFCHAGCSQSEVRTALQALGLLPERGASREAAARPRPRAPKPKPQPDRDPAAYARKTWARSVPIEGTVAEAYLRRHRRIPGELPDQLRIVWSLWHKNTERYFPALLVPVFGEGGALLRLHAVYLDLATGDKADIPKRKKTFGTGTMPAIFRGAPGGPFDVILTEGPEDALSLRSALETGDTAASLGASSLHRPEIAPGTRVCIVADGDEPGARAARRAAAEHTIRGCKVWIATPPAGVKDANDVLKAFGATGIRAMIDAAERFQATPAVGTAVAALEPAEAAERCDAAIAEAFREGLAWKAPKMWGDIRLTADGMIDLGSDWDARIAPVFGVKATLGLGKTEAVLQQLADPALADTHLNVYAPAHRLNGELQKRAEAKAVPGSPHVRVIRGRQQTLPDETPMCPKAGLAGEIEALGLPVQEHLCEKKGKKGGEPERCEFFDTCLYQHQLRDKGPGVRLHAHAHTIVDHHEADTFNVIDESFWASTLRGADKPYYLPFAWLKVFRSVPMLGHGMRAQFGARDDGATAELLDISQRCLKAIEAGGKLADFAAEDITSSDCKHAAGLEYRRIEALAVTPAMEERTQRERVKNYATQTAFKLARFFTLAGEALEAGVEPALSCFEIRPGCPNGKSPPEDRIYMLWRRDLKLGDVPTLLIDADLAPEIAREFFPQLGEIATIDARMSNYHATQVIDRTFSKASLVGDVGRGRRAKLRRLLEVRAAEGKKVLLVTYKEAAEAIQAEAIEALGKPIEGVEYAHWNDLRGRDQWADIDTLIVAGCPQPGEREIERMARALWYKDTNTIKTLPKGGEYRPELRSIAMADGATVPTMVKEHPDPRCTLILDQIRNETMQAIGRARLVHRDASKPCEVILLTPYPTGLPIHEIKPWNDVVPDLLALLVARGAVPSAWPEVETLLSDVIKGERGEPGHAAREAFRRAELPSPVDLIAARIPHDRLWELYYRSSCGIRLYRYRLRGRRKSGEILIDPRRYPDPRATLEATFGELDRFELLEPDEALTSELTAAPPVAPAPAQPEPPQVTNEPEIVDEPPPPPPEPEAFVGGR